MPDLIRPHGGLSEPVNCTIREPTVPSTAPVPVSDAPKDWKPVSISGRDLREKLRAGELPDPRILRPETARVLIERMKVG